VADSILSVNCAQQQIFELYHKKTTHSVFGAQDPKS